MKEQEILLQDKWLEINYHFALMKSNWDNINKDKAKYSREFKYEFNSLVNSFRSITFVLQKCFKNKHSEFEKWYSEVQIILKNDEFADKIHQLRNINQKEGNIHPKIVEIKTLNKYFNQRIVYTPISPNKNKLLEKLELSEKGVPKNIVEYDFIPIMSSFDNSKVIEFNGEEDFEKIKEEKTKELIKDVAIQVERKKMEITKEDFINSSFVEYKIILLDREYDWNTFINECYRLILFFKEKCLEAVELFVN